MMIPQIQTEKKRYCNDGESVMCVISDLLKTLISAKSCAIFIYDRLSEELKSVYSDFENEICIKPSSGMVGLSFSRKKSFISADYTLESEGVGFEVVGLDDKTALSYVVTDDDEEPIGVVLFIGKKERVFEQKDLQSIKPLNRYIAKELKRIKPAKSAHIPAREISLALYDKNSALVPSLENDLIKAGYEKIFRFSVFIELKHKIQNHREKSFILICVIKNSEEIYEIAKEILNTNIPIIMIGPDSDDLILCAGKYNVSSYLAVSKYSSEGIYKKIIDNFYKITKNPDSRSSLSIFIGTTGGTGTTTISANFANVLSKQNAFKNILYMDFSTTKAISNIFFGIASPSKSIVDFMQIEDYSEENMLNSGLYQIRNNLYMIPGIQSHMDREEIIGGENEQKIINMIYRLKNMFDFVIIDGGLAKDSELQIAIEEISDKIFIVTELTTIHVSVLQTYYELMKKAGWKDKIKIVLNREDSQNAISIKDASEILNSKNSKDITFDIHIPNGGDYIRECWNFGKLITNEYPNVKFSKAIKESRFYSDLELGFSDDMKKPSLFKKFFSRSLAGSKT